MDTASEMLRMARRRAGLSQRELARRAGIPQPTISRIERGRLSPTLDTLEPLVRACGMRVLVEDDPTEGLDRSLLRDLLRRSPRERVAHHARGAAVRRRLARARPRDTSA